MQSTTVKVVERETTSAGST